MKEKIIDDWIHEAGDKIVDLGKRDFGLSLHVLVEKEEEFYTAHCLEFDLVAEGYTIKEAEKSIIRAIVSYISFCIASGNEDKIFNPAPREYWNKFYLCSKKISGPLEIPKKLAESNPTLSNIQKFIKDVSFGKYHSSAYA